MRQLLLALGPFTAVAGCRETPSESVAGPDPGPERIECRIGEAAGFERFCRVEQAGDEIIVRKPDGGFRRLRLVRDGRGVVAADGAEPARVSIVADNAILVEIGGDAFRLPARIAGR